MCLTILFRLFGDEEWIEYSVENTIVQLYARYENSKANVIIVR
jgi:hypothetical protein